MEVCLKTLVNALLRLYSLLLVYCVECLTSCDIRGEAEYKHGWRSVSEQCKVPGLISFWLVMGGATLYHFKASVTNPLKKNVSEYVFYDLELCRSWSIFAYTGVEMKIWNVFSVSCA